MTSNGTHNHAEPPPIGWGQGCPACDEWTRAEHARHDARRARRMRAEGASLYIIGAELGRSKEWLREYAGLID